MIDEILKENKTINLSKTMIVYLKELENYIPENLRTNFYNNLKTLKIAFNENIKTGNKSPVGKYDHKNNKIFLDSATVIKTMQKQNIEKEEILKSVEQIFLHEFVHMASSSYNNETNTLITGFEKNGSITNTALNEGMTELISLSIVKPKYQILSEYIIEQHLTNQLLIIIGQNNMLESYFSGTETKIIEEKLQELGKKVNIEQNTPYKLLREIENVYIFKESNNEQDCLANAQNMLLTYLDTKLYLLQQESKQDEIDYIISRYSQSILTPKKLSIDEYQRFINIEQTQKYFEEIKEKYQSNNSIIKRK